MKLNVKLEETNSQFNAYFEEVYEIKTPSGEIPKEYGLITYDQERIITVS